MGGGGIFFGNKCLSANMIEKNSVSDMAETHILKALYA